MQFTPTDPKVVANKARIKEILNNRNVEIYFMPSNYLRGLVEKNEHPHVKSMPDIRKADILSGLAIHIQRRLVDEWIDGTLDEKNAFILYNGDIRVIDGNYQLFDNGESKAK